MFKVGDEVVLPLKIEKICNEELVGAKSEADVTYLFKIEEANRVLKPRESKTYEQGLADAWELVEKIYYLSYSDIEQVFGVAIFLDVIKNFTYKEALAKIEAYEKKKEIKVGDVVESRDAKRKFLVVTEEDDDSVYEFGVIDLKTLTLDRICNYPKGFTKTGKHIDIESLLKQIGE